jgi:TP901 family phage tail tape measure protein
MTEAEIEFIIRARQLNLDPSIRELLAMGAEMRRQAKEIRKQGSIMQKSIEKIKKSWQKLNTALTKVRNSAWALFTALVAFGSIPIGLYAKFEKELSNTNTLMNLSRKELKQYEKDLYSLSNKTGKSATELAKGLYDVVSAGVSSGNSLAVLEKATKASQAGITQVNTAVKAGISNINAYDMSLSDLNKIYDIQFKTVKSGIITYNELAENLGEIIPSASALGVELEDLYSGLAFLTKQGQNANIAATSLSGAFEELSENAQDIKKVFGVNVFGDDGEFRGLAAVFGDLRERMEGLSTEAQQAMLNQVGFGEEATRAIIPLIQNYEQFKDVLAEVSNSSGAMEEAYKEATDNIITAFNKLKETAINTARYFGSIYRDEIIELISKLQAFISAIGDFIEENKEATKELIKFSIKLAGVAAAIIAVASALLFLMSPVGALITSISLLYAAWRLNVFGIRDETKVAFEAVKEKYDELVEKGIIDKIKSYGELVLKVVFEVLKDALKAIEKAANGDWSDLIGITADVLTLWLSLKLLPLALGDGLGATILKWIGGFIGGSALAGAGTVGAVATISIRLLEDFTTGDMSDVLKTLLDITTGGLLGFAIGGPVGAVWGITIAVGFEFTENLDKIGEAAKNIITGKNAQERAQQRAEEFRRSVLKSDYTVSVKENVLNEDLNGNGSIGFMSGGYTGNLPIDEIAGVVHGGEWVAPAWMVNSSEFRPIIDQLESVRKGYKSGGYVVQGYKEAGFVTKNKEYLSQSGISQDSMFYGMLNALAKIAEDTGEFAKWVDGIGNLANLTKELKEKMQSVEDKTAKIKEENQKALDELKQKLSNQTQTLEQRLAEANQLLSNSFTQGLSSDDPLQAIQSNIGQSILSKVDNDLGKIFGDKFKESFINSDLGKELNNIMDNLDESLTGDVQKDAEKLIKARQEVVDTLNEFGLTIEDAGDKVKTTFSDALSELSSFAGNMAQLTGSEGWGVAGSVLGRINSFSTQLGNFKASEGLMSMGGLTSAFGMGTAVLGVAGAISSSIDKKNAKLLEEYNKQVEINENQLELLKQIQDNTKDTVKNIIKAVSQNPTNSNITLAQEQLKKQANFMIDNPTFLDQINVTGKDKDRSWHKGKRKNYSYSMYEVAQGLGLDTSMFNGLGEDVMSLPFEELQKFQEEFSKIDYEEFKDKFKGSIDKSFSTDLEVIQEQLETYVETIEALGKAQEEIGKSSRLESFEGIDYISHADAVEQYKEQLKETYESAGYTKEEIEGMEESIASVAEGLAENTNNIVTAMQDVRSSFIDTFTDGKSVLESFATGLSSLFDKLKNNIAGMIYNIDLSDLNTKFEDFFEKFNTKLSEYEGTNVMGYAERLLGDDVQKDIKVKNSFFRRLITGDKYNTRTIKIDYMGDELDSLFSDMKDLEEKQQNMDTIVDIIREKAKEAGLSEEIIDLMLPATEASKKAQEIANSIKNSLSNAMSAALDSGSVLDFIASMGESIYNNAKEALINAFMESKVYQDMFSKWFETDSIEFTGNIDTDLENMTSLLDDFESELNKAGLGFNYSDVASESDSESGTSSSEFYGGASVSGETTQIINNNYYYQPKDNNFFDGNKQSLYREFLEWKEKIKAKE